MTLRRERLLQRVEDLGADPQALGEARGPSRDDHELLEVDRVVGVSAAVQHVHHRHRQHRRLAAAVELGQIPVERLLGIGSSGLRRRQRNPEQRVRPQPPLVWRRVELDHRLVERPLLRRPRPDQRLGDLPIHVVDRLAHALAAPSVPPVPQLHRLELPGRGAGGNRRETSGTRLERDLNLNGRVAARIEDLAGVDRLDDAHRGANPIRRPTSQDARSIRENDINPAARGPLPRGPPQHPRS